MALKAPRPKRSRARREAERSQGCEPVPRGWSRTMRRWLSVQAAQNQEAEHWTAVVLDQPGGPVRIPLEAIKAVTVGNLSQVLEQGLTEVLRERRRAAWLAENEKAIDRYNARVAKKGVFSDGWRKF